MNINIDIEAAAANLVRNEAAGAFIMLNDL